MASSDSRVRRRSRGGERRSGEARHHGGEHQRTAVEAGATGRHTGPFGVNWSSVAGFCGPAESRSH